VCVRKWIEDMGNRIAEIGKRLEGGKAEIEKDIFISP